MASRAALIAGASGLIGGRCLRLLLDEPAFNPVVALVRKPLPIKHDKLRQLEINTEHLSGLPPMTGGVVISALGTTIRKAGSRQEFRFVDYDLPLEIARRGLEAGAASFVFVSSIGADRRSSNFYLRVKGEFEHAAENVGYPSLHVMQPSLLLGDRSESRPAEQAGVVLSKLFAWTLIGALKRYKPVQAADVAKAMLVAAKSTTPGMFVHQWREIMRAARS
jgi:uncharacterized protein YbjT (DUF2867 family)